MARVTGSLLALGLCAACGASVRNAPRGPQPDNAAATLVQFPPPPAKVEILPEDPGEPCLWVDGHYNWVGRRWQWEAGGWFVVPEGCHLAEARLVWAPEGSTLYYTPPGFYLDSGKPCPELKQCETNKAKP
jgi:hypothetical protein